MRIVQSLWTKNSDSFLHTTCGWLTPEHHIMSWALSCLTIKSFYNNNTLYCDSITAKVLIDVLELPYSEVLCTMDSLHKEFHPDLWALPKIKTYAAQEQPFLHVDGDIFIWKKFDDKLMEGGLIAQNLDKIGSFEKIMQNVTANSLYIPKEIALDRQQNPDLLTYNAGILGGTNISFFKEYSAEAFLFIEKNKSAFSKFNVSGFNIIFEQYLFYCMVKSTNLKVQVLFDQLISDQGYKGFGDFDLIPYRKQYIHLLGEYKRNPDSCHQMAQRLQLEFPEYYYKIIDLFKKNKIPLFKKYHYFDENNLTELHHKTREAYRTETLKKVDDTVTITYQYPTLNHLDLLKNPQRIHPFQVQDAKQFCDKINTLLTEKFQKISPHYLMGRDVNATAYFEFLFASTATIDAKTLVADSICEVVESHFDWSEFLENRKPKSNNRNNEKTTLLLIPECGEKGFSIAKLDRLELNIFRILKTPKTVEALLKELKLPTNKNSENEYLLLIYRKIKKAIQNKSIRVKMEV
jgi:hypothetical protein